MHDFREGLKAAVPIFLGYLSVSFGIGILAAGVGFSVLQAAILSITNLTSAGQAAGIEIIAAAGTVVELILSQIVINLRYALMSLSLSQKLDPRERTANRMLIAYGITDEIFAVAYGRGKPVTSAYMAGLILNSAVGWVLGTILGAFAGNILPAAVVSALGLMLYGMFIAIFLPVAKRDRHVLFVVVLSAALSTCFRFLLPGLSSGFSIIISSLVAAVIAARLFPRADEEEEVEE